MPRVCYQFAATTNGKLHRPLENEFINWESFGIIEII
jgi:hypothetical protein